MLVSLLPGLRELRAPLAAGYLWLLSVYLLVAPHVPDRGDAEGIVADLYSLEGVATALGLGIAASFVAYLIGTLSSGFLNPLLRTGPPRLRELLHRDGLTRPARLTQRSWVALRDLVIDALREVDAVLAESQLTLARLVRDEVPARGRHDERKGLVESVLDAVANELDLVKTRLLGEEVDLFSAVDRHQAEADFRLAVLPPLGVLAGVVVVAAGPGWVGLAAVLVAVPVIVGLGRQAFAADGAGTEVLVDALRLRRVASPTLERLDAAARRAAELAPDAPLPPLRAREAAVDATVQELHTAVSWARPVEGSPVPEDVRGHARVASDGLERLAVYLPHGTGLHERMRRIQALLRAETLTGPELDELEEAVDAIAELAESALESPGQLEELAADEEKLREALAAGDRRQRLLAQHALVDAVATTRDLARLLELMSVSIRDPELASPRLRRAFENAARRDPATVAGVSWQGAHLPGAALTGVRLPAIDFRDADLTNAVLAGCDLSSARLHNATLVGSDLRGADLFSAALVYTDLAGADLREANLAAASLESPLVQGMRLAGARLVGAAYDSGSIPWHLIEGWSEAELDPEDRAIAETIGGRAPEGPRILMLSWEAPPLVAGGSWTACWHLVRSLRAQGADVTVVVPWAESLCEPRPFGIDVEVEFAGVEPSIPAPYVASGGPFPPYLPYSAYSPYWWDAGAPDPTFSAYGAAARLAVDEFASWLSAWRRLPEFALVHAHDWVTFPAAARAAERAGLPWIAHVHSTAADRRPDSVDRRGKDVERQIEYDGVHGADAVIVPSGVTAARIADEYGAGDVLVVPNQLAREAPPPRSLGDPAGKRVVFVGRLAAQKWPERFVDVARHARAHVTGAGEWTFVVFGDGEERPRLEALADGAVTFAGAVPWAERDRAFEGASVVVVPSRSEPFGMVIAEAMQRGVPTVYAEDAGIGEFVADAGVRVDPQDLAGLVDEIASLLARETYWRKVADRQLEEIGIFASRKHERRVRAAWSDLVAGAAAEPSRR